MLSSTEQGELVPDIPIMQEFRITPIKSVSRGSPKQIWTDTPRLIHHKCVNKFRMTKSGATRDNAFKQDV